MTNRQFAQEVGCSVSMASLLRNGHRLPSATLLASIVERFELDFDPASLPNNRVRALKTFSQFLRDEVFGDSSRAA